MMSSSSVQMPHSKKGLALRNQALGKKSGTGLARKQLSTPSHGQNSAVKEEMTNAPSGTLAALKLNPPLKIAMSFTVTQAARVCVTKKTDCFLVTDNGDVVGIVTSKDIAYRLVAGGLDPHATLVSQTMTYNPIFVDATSTAKQALDHMVSNKCRHLPVRSEDGSVIGILGIAEVFHEALDCAHRRSIASEKLFSAMAGVEADMGIDISTAMLAWTSKLRETTVLPNLASIMGTKTRAAIVGPKATVREVARLMQDMDTTAVCVTIDVSSAPSGRQLPRLVGVFTTKDIVSRVIAPGLDAPICSVIRVMTRKPETAYSTMSTHGAVTQMYMGRYLNIPVVEEDGRLVAVVSMSFLAEATQKQIKATVQAHRSQSPPFGDIYPEPANISEFHTIDTTLVQHINASAAIPMLATSRSQSIPLGDIYPEPVNLSEFHIIEGIPELVIRTKSDNSDASVAISMLATSVGDMSLKSASDGDLDDLENTLESAFVPSSSAPLFSFKFHAPSHITYRVQAPEDDYEQLQEVVARTLATDPFFDANNDSNSNLRPDPNDFRILYEDDDDDTVIITTSHDILDAVNTARRMGKDRVMLIVRGGSSWMVAGSVAAEIQPTIIRTPTAPRSTNQPTLVSQFIQGTPPPEYSPRERSENVTPLHVHSEEKRTAENIKALIDRLADILNNVALYRRLLSCLDIDAQKLLDMFQTLLDIPGLSAKFRRSLLVATQRLSRRVNLYPTCYSLEDIEMVEETPIAAGGFADIYKARFLGQCVCLKVIRIYQTLELQKFIKQFSAEAILWGQLSHANLLPIYGLYRYNGRLCLVSPWMPFGDITEFLKEYPDENRPLLVWDVGCGLAYLHKNDIVHGDLKGANILVNGCGRACLADFGLSGVSDASILRWTSHSSAGSKGGSLRWQAPELLDPENEEVIHNTKASDVYAFSCVTYEIFTGNVPFFDHFRDSMILLKVQAGEQPPRPPVTDPAWGSWGLTEATWSLMQACWSADATQRPTIDDVVSKLEKTIPAHDDRPLESEDVILSPAHFRDSVGGRIALPSVVDVDDILSRSEVLNSEIAT